MFKLSFFSLLFLALLNLAAAASSVQYWQSPKQGYYVYTGTVQASSASQLNSVVEKAYNDMVADIEAYNKANHKAAPIPSMMTGIFDGTSITLCSSSKSGTASNRPPTDFPKKLTEAMDRVNASPKCHRNNARCSEPMALATYVDNHGDLPNSAKAIVSTYGLPPSGQKGLQNPCSTHDDGKGYGCKALLEELKLDYFSRSGAVVSNKSKPPAGKHRREIVNEIRSLLLMVRDLQAFDNFLAKREFLMSEEEYF
jgi:hypothetical protein